MGRIDITQYIYKQGYMDTEAALATLSALSQSTPLGARRHAVERIDYLVGRDRVRRRDHRPPQAL